MPAEQLRLRPFHEELACAPQTIASLLAGGDAGDVALLAPARPPLSFGDLREHLQATATALGAAGIGREDRVAVVLPNGPEMAAAFLAISSVAACAPLNPAYRETEFEFYLDDLQPKAIILEAGAESPARTVAHARGIPVLELSTRPEAPAGRFELGIPAGCLGAPRPPALAEPGDVALLLHTSGTTSRPKLVPLTQANLCRSAINIGECLRLEPGDRCLNIMPLFHIHGLVGATLSSMAAGASIICSPGFVAPLFFEWLDQFKPTWYTAVPTMHQGIVSRAAAHRDIIARRPLRLIRSSSAPLPPSVMEELEEAFGAPVIESYGMTEAAHQMASNPLPPGVRKPGSVGLPAGPDVAIMNGQGALLAAGEVGEVVIRGASVFHGYAANPEANAGAFTGGWFRTGDLGRLDSDGYLFLSGRTKEIINRGGEKISPREVDEALLEHPAVAQALTFALPDARLGEDVGAVVVLRGGAAAVGELELADFVATRLADFKVPRRILFLDEIPKGPTGKPQRIGLAARLVHLLEAPAPAAEACGSGARREPTATEAWLLGLFKDVLRVPSEPTPGDSFFDLGGDSILAMQLATRIRTARGIALPPIRIFQLKTATALAAYLDGLAAVPPEGRSPDAIVAGPPAGGAPVTLSFAQERIWFLSEYEDEPVSYVTPVLYRLTGPLDLDALNHAMSELVTRHEAARTVFSMTAAGLRGQILPPAPIEIPVLDVSGQEGDALGREQRAREAIAARARQGFDLSREPMIRLFLVRLSAQEHLLLLQKHHIASDGWTTSVIWRELSALYEARRRPEAAAGLPPLPIQYRDYAAWQRRSCEEEEMQRQLDFWVRELSGRTSPLLMPADQPRPPRQTFRGARAAFRLPRELAAAVRARSRQEQCTLFMTLLAAWQALLHRYTGETAFCVGTPIAGRTRLETEPLIGMFVNTLALRADLAGQPSFRQLLHRVRQTALDAYSHQDLPFDRLIEALRPERALSYSPLFQVMFQLRNYAPALPTLCGVAVEQLDFDPGVALFDLTLEATESGEEIALLLNYNRDLFQPATAGQILRSYTALLEAAVRDPDQPVAALPLLSGETRRQMLGEWNQTAREWDGPGLAHQRIEQQAALAPEALAVTGGGRSYSYGELNRRANQLARRLRRAGARTGTRVALSMDRSIDLMAGLLGILKSGAAYVPLDPAYPEAWRQGVMEDAGISITVTESMLTDPALDDEDGANLDTAASPGDPAYVIFTSGSTGRPKGVEISHRALDNILESLRREPGLTAGDVLLAVSSFSFDIALVELLLPLIAGGRLWIAGRAAAADGDRLADLLSESRATVFQATPATWRLLIESGWNGCPGLRAWSAGEELGRDLANRLLDRVESVWNLYGPSETAIYSTAARVRRGAGPVPIGRPVANTEVAVLDGGGQPVPAGVPGELYIGGVGVAGGYINRPESTAASFVQPPVAEAGWRGPWYRTGDLVRYLPDGNLVFLRRLDNQVKLRGFRIELGEVESALGQHPAVGGAVAVIQGDRLVAYVTPAAASPATSQQQNQPQPGPDSSTLRAFLKDRLPAHEVPSAIVVLDRFPLTGSGKVDRNKLKAPAPVPQPAASNDGEGWDDRTRKLARIWADILAVPGVGLHDDFFDLGGHSLLSVRLLAQVNSEFGVKLPLARLFSAPTVAQLAESLRDGSAPAAASGSSLVPIQVGETATPPVFLVSRLGALIYQSLARHLGPAQTVYALVPPGPDDGARPVSRFEELAAHYVREIRRVQPAGPYLIGGYSLGSFPAYEMARQLTLEGEHVALLFLIDGSAHILPQYQAALPWMSLLGYRLRHWMRGARFHLEEFLGSGRGLRYLSDLAARRRRHRNRLRADFGQDQSLPEALRVVEQANQTAFRAYSPKPYTGRVTQVRSTRGYTGFDLARHGWCALAARVDTHEVPGSDHLELMAEPHVATVAAILKRAIGETGLSTGQLG